MIKVTNKEDNRATELRDGLKQFRASLNPIRTDDETTNKKLLNSPVNARDFNKIQSKEVKR